MGLLSEGTPLEWKDVASYVDYVREHGIIQLLNTIKQYGDRKNDPMLWGDELEYMVVQLEDSCATLSVRQEEILGKLMAVNSDQNVAYHQEYGRYMIESTPRLPFGDSLRSLDELETNMHLRRDIARSYLSPNEHIVTFTSYPMLGVGHCAATEESVRGPATDSLFLPDDIINLHPRFPTLSANIRKRRGKKVEIAVPVYEDKKTPRPWKDPLTDERPDGVPSDAIYMDAMGFGMGCCCIQLTFQGSSMDSARNLFDALAPLTPIMLALSAASPVFRGVLADQDVRWNVVSMSVDDRTDEEKLRIPKSRYDSIDCYISRENLVFTKDIEFYNDIKVNTNPVVTDQLNAGGLSEDPLLVQHFSHLFIRDPLVIFEERINQDDKVSKDHFENIQSTNWQTMRFKPPPDAIIGWRVEFRPMEIQLTDFENAAFGAVVVLVARAIVEQNYCFYQPISQIEENMRAAHIRDPVNRAKFWVRKSIQNQTAESPLEFVQLSLNDIINGSEEYIGIIPLVKQYLKKHAIELDSQFSAKIDSYLNLISKRASGKLLTGAQWIRKFITEHPKYAHDSLVTDEINYDLVMAVDALGKGQNWDTLGKGFLP